MKTSRIAMLAAVFLALSLAVPGCDSHETPTPTDSGGPRGEFSIYLLTEDSRWKLDYGQIEEDDLEQLELEDEPLLSIEDIDYYDFTTHYIYLNEDFESLRQRHGLAEYFEISGAPFVVVAGDIRRYLGRFPTPASSSWPPDCPTLVASDVSGTYRLPDNALWMAPSPSVLLSSSSLGGYDVRNDWRIRQVLEQAGKLR
jgi:hypothetical protein